MDIRKLIGVDPVVDVGGNRINWTKTIRLKVAHRGNAQYHAREAEPIKPFLAEDAKPPTVEQSEAIQTRLLVDTVLLDWEWQPASLPRQVEGRSIAGGILEWGRPRVLLSDPMRRR